MVQLYRHLFIIISYKANKKDHMINIEHLGQTHFLYIETTTLVSVLVFRFVLGAVVCLCAADFCV